MCWIISNSVVHCQSILKFGRWRFTGLMTKSRTTGGTDDVKLQCVANSIPGPFPQQLKKSLILTTINKILANDAPHLQRLTIMLWNWMNERVYLTFSVGDLHKNSVFFWIGIKILINIKGKHCRSWGSVDKHHQLSYNNSVTFVNADPLVVHASSSSSSSAAAAAATTTTIVYAVTT